MEDLTLLRLRVTCPECGREPALRITEAERQRHHHLRPGELVATYQCQGTACRETYALPARAFQLAR